MFAQPHSEKKDCYSQNSFALWLNRLLIIICTPSLLCEVADEWVLPITLVFKHHRCANLCSSLHWPLRQRAAWRDGREHSGDITEPTWCNDSTLAQNARTVGSSHAIGTIFPIFITPTVLVPWPGSCTSCMVVEPTLSMYTYGHCLYVWNCKH